MHHYRDFENGKLKKGKSSYFVTKTDDTFTCQPCQSEHSVQSRVVFSPCGHGSCADCAAQLEKCHICTNVIESEMKQFE